MKNLHTNNLNKIYDDWIKYTIGHNPSNKNSRHNIEDFMMIHEDELTPSQNKFLRSLLDVMVEIQNHENMPNEWIRNYSKTRSDYFWSS